MGSCASTFNVMFCGSKPYDIGRCHQEFFKDPRTGKLNIVVSLSTGSYGPFLPYVYTANDATLRSWSGPVVMSGISNAGLGYIDTFPVYFKWVYHSFSIFRSN